MKHITRRGALKGMAAGAAAVSLLGGNQANAAETTDELPAWKNADFYKDGKFDAEAAKKAYYTLMEFHKFPVMPVLKTDQFWVLDFGLGNFAEAGMGGIFYINDKRDDYLLHDIWLLPGQMIPEHCHLKTETVAAKMEAWLVRHGMAWMYSVGTPNPGDEDRIPPMHRKIAVARSAKKTMPGEVVKLEVAEQKHFMLAGPQGAIVTEVATYHDMAALRFTHPDAKV
jgi:D-lyxose ketol-isomerase